MIGKDQAWTGSVLDDYGNVLGNITGPLPIESGLDNTNYSAMAGMCTWMQESVLLEVFQIFISKARVTNTHVV